MNKMDLIKQNMGKRKEKTLDALSDNLIRSKSASIPLSQIKPNPNNHAASEDNDEDVQRLADDIATVGLLHNLVVNQTGETEYTLISGERRFRALQKLGWSHAPCVVYDHLPDAMLGVMTVLANLDAREYSAAKRLQLYQELDTQLRELKKLGIYRGGISRGIAQMMGVSEQQIGKYRKLTTLLSSEEIAGITNIDNAYKEINRQKTESHFQFSTSPAQQKSPEQFAKTETQFQFSSSPTHQETLEQPAKTESHFQFLGSQGSLSRGGQEIKKQYDRLTEEPTQLTIDGEPEAAPVEAPTPVKQMKSYRITAQELSIEYGGTSYLCAFGSHVNGGWIAILNFGVAAELSSSKYDMKHNTRKIREALEKSNDPWLPEGEKLNEAAAYIANIVTEKMGG